MSLHPFSKLVGHVHVVTALLDLISTVLTGTATPASVCIAIITIGRALLH
jgi:hypothetical protein